ncbi:MATE family efflux transporter [Acetivibrio clariflavus]|nr:MATE family efflux transporter [Acetivibrio clariflavus]
MSNNQSKVSTKSIFAIAIPLILQQFFYQLQVLVDRAMLGHVNSDYFSAIGNALFPFYTIWSAVIAVCGGTTILVAQCLGAKDNLQAKQYAECSFAGNSAISIIFFFVFFLGPGVIFRIMGVQSPILEYSISYVKILSFSLILLGAETTATSIVQGIGTTKIIMYGGILRNILNIFFDWVFIFGKLGMPRMEIDGAAFATTLSNVIVAPILIMYVFKSKKIPFKLSLRNVIKTNWRLYKKVIKIGIPSGIESSLWNIGNLIVIKYLNILSMTAVGIYTLIFSIEMLPFLLYMGLARASMTLVGHKTGEDNHKEAVRTGFRCMRYSLFICALISLTFIIFPDKILSIFTNDRSLIEKSVPFLIFISFTMFPRAINNVIGLGIQGIGDTKWMLYGQIMGTITMVSLSYLLIFNAGLGLLGLYITFFIDEFIRAIINILRFWKGREFFFLKPFEKVITSSSNVDENV